MPRVVAFLSVYQTATLYQLSTGLVGMAKLMVYGKAKSVAKLCRSNPNLRIETGRRDNTPTEMRHWPVEHSHS